MAISTIVIIACLVLLVVIEVFFKRDIDEMEEKYSVYKDSDFDGLDGMSGVVGMNTDDIGIDYQKR